MPSHELLGGKVRVYQRSKGSVWQCSCCIDGKQLRVSTKQSSLELAKDFAEDWYLTVMGKSRAGLLTSEITFAKVAKQFLHEYAELTHGQRNQRWSEGYEIRLRLYLLPFLGHLGISQITAGKVQEYRIHRTTASLNGKPPSRSTRHHEMVTIRQVLKTAIRHGWLDHLPDLTEPYKSRGKIVHRLWFSPAEYRQLYNATREHARQPFHRQDKWSAEQVHDFVLFMANTGLRPDEARNLQHRDVAIVQDEATGQQILEIEVRGKRGIGYCKSTSMAVRPYERLLARPKPGLPQGKRARRRRGENPKELPLLAEVKFPQPADPVFPGNHIKMFNGLLTRAKLKEDRDGNKRTAYSLRHTYICMRLMEGADIYQVAKNCRTSVEMIQKFYAAHIKNSLDASAINVMRRKIQSGWTKSPANDQVDSQSQLLLFDTPAGGRDRA